MEDILTRSARRLLDIAWEWLLNTGDQHAGRVLEVLHSVPIASAGAPFQAMAELLVSPPVGGPGVRDGCELLRSVLDRMDPVLRRGVVQHAVSTENKRLGAILSSYLTPAQLWEWFLRLIEQDGRKSITRRQLAVLLHESGKHVSDPLAFRAFLKLAIMTAASLTPVEVPTEFAESVIRNKYVRSCLSNEAQTFFRHRSRLDPNAAVEPADQYIKSAWPRLREAERISLVAKLVAAGVTDVRELPEVARPFGLLFDDSRPERERFARMHSSLMDQIEADPFSES
jgi:hypothetical protein